MKLSDEVIGHIAKCVQLAILTGTDVIDHLRMIKLKEADNELYLTEDCESQSEENIQKMLNEIKQLG